MGLSSKMFHYLCHISGQVNMTEYLLNAAVYWEATEYTHNWVTEQKMS